MLHTFPDKKRIDYIILINRQRIQCVGELDRSTYKYLSRFFLHQTRRKKLAPIKQPYVSLLLVNMDSSMLCVLFFLPTIIPRPATQKILFNNHLWEVPNEPGWDTVIQDAEPVRQLLNQCQSTSECRRAIQKFLKIFSQHSVSRTYLESNLKSNPKFLHAIFKWG